MAGERTLPGISLTGYWNAGDNTWKAGMDENLRKLSVLVQLRVLSRTIWPGFEDSNSPGVADGDIYIVPATDSNSQQDSNSVPAHGYIAVHDDGSWVYYAPLEGFIAYVIDEAAYYRFDGSAWVAFGAGGDASSISYNSGDTGDSNSVQTNVADALDDLYARIRDVSGGGGASLAWTNVGDWNHSVSGDTAFPIEFTGLSGDEILVEIEGVTKGVSGNFTVQVSTDNGSTWFTTSGDYLDLQTSGSAASTTTLLSAQANATAARSMSLHLIAAGAFDGHRIAKTNSANPVTAFVASAAAINAIRVGATGGGNATGGRIRVYTR